MGGGSYTIARGFPHLARKVNVACRALDILAPPVLVGEQDLSIYQGGMPEVDGCGGSFLASEAVQI